MSQWGTSDAASNSVLWAPTSVRQAPTRENANLLYGNTTSNAYGDGQRITMLAVDSTEEGIGAGNVAFLVISNAGSGYTGNATITFSGGGGTGAAANAFANLSTGKITGLNITNGGSSYENNPTFVISAPSAITFNGNSAVSNTADTITLTSANSKFQVGDSLTYTVATGNTAVSGLTSGTTYFVSHANSTTIALSTTNGGSNVNLTSGGPSETGHSLTGVTATGYAVVGGAQNKGIPHTGWVLRTEGTGGRAGRVMYEVLVAGGIGTDGSDDKILPDS